MGEPYLRAEGDRRPLIVASSTALCSLLAGHSTNILHSGAYLGGLATGSPLKVKTSLTKTGKEGN